VFEAASWALAGRRLTPEQRQKRWLEPLPAVEMAERLARLPLFQVTSVDELFRIAGTGRQVRHEPGRVIYEAGRRAADLQFLLDGEVSRTSVEADGKPGAPETVTGPASLGFDEAFEGVPQRATVKASGIAICLSLVNEQFLGLLSENSELAEGVFKMMLDTHGATLWGEVLRDVTHPPSTARLGDGLQPIEKVLILEEMPVFSRASGEQLAALAGITREVKLSEGDVLFGAGDAPAIHIVLDGELALEPMGGGQPLAAGPGDATGIYETLGGLDSTAWRGHVVRGGLALKVEREALFDLLADQIDLLQGLFSALPRQTAPAAEVAGTRS
jgi:CRP-like cAMP-binding protein